MLDRESRRAVGLCRCYFDIDVLTTSYGLQAKCPPSMPSVKFNTKELTTNTGAPIISNEYSLRAGKRGPVLLEDYHLLEKLG